MSLATYNKIACGAHFTLGTFFSIFFPIINKNNPQSQNLRNELALQDHNAFIQGNPVVVAWKSETSIATSLTTAQVMLIAFYYITSLFHGIYAYSDVYSSPDDPNAGLSGIYPSMIKAKNNYLRWVEYAITSTLMINIIALLCTVKDTNAFILLNSCNVVMITLGQMVEEKIREGKSPIVPMAASFFLLLSEFFVITRDYSRHVNQFSNYIQTNSSIEPIPSWITYMLSILFLFFACFGFVALYQSIYPNTEYEVIEKIYIILSLVAKTALGIFVAYGAAGGQQRF
jgi:Heliorhodopsin